jgi:hypothetical protein
MISWHIVFLNLGYLYAVATGGGERFKIRVPPPNAIPVNAKSAGPSPINLDMKCTDCETSHGKMLS